jgi:hypothetical protein
MPNYRAVYKSDHLGVIDLEELTEQGKPLVFTIAKVQQEIGATVAGAKGNFNIAYFAEPIKPLVLNATNANTLRRLGNFGTDVDTWANIPVELYIDATVKMKGQVVGGVRIKTISPRVSAPISDTQAIASINAAKDLEGLKSAWLGLTKQEQTLATVIAAKDSRKIALTNGAV